MTFTVLAVDPRSRVLGVATASFSLAVGNSVPAVDAATGVVASQAWTNRRLRHAILAELRAGRSAGEAISIIEEVDPEAALRQVGVVDRTGHGASHTGSDCTPWAGARSQPGLLVLGNCLAGPDVLTAMEKRFLADDRPASAHPPSIDLAARLVATLHAGQDAGGDVRGDQSAAVLVARAHPDRQWPPDLDVDLRVDDAADPIPELDRLLRLARTQRVPHSE